MDMGTSMEAPKGSEDRPLRRALAKLGQQVEQAKKLVGIWRGRLEPVLRPAPEAGNPARESRPRAGGLVVVAVEECADEIQGICVELDRLLGRLEV